MLDFLKQVAESWSERIRSPFIGSIFLVFVGWNWQVLFFLFFADVRVSVRLSYFDANTDNCTLYLIPIFGGVILAVALPWLTWVGAKFAKVPKAWLHELQFGEVVRKRIHELEEKAKEEAAKAQIEIERADRKRHAREIGDEELEKELSAIVNESEGPKDAKGRDISEGWEGRQFNELSSAARTVLISLGKTDAAMVDFQRPPNSNYYTDFSIGGAIVADKTDGRLFATWKEGLEELDACNLVAQEPSAFRLTQRGINVFDSLTSKEKS